MQKSISFLFFSFLVFSAMMLSAQPDRWQQKVKYKMDINMDVASNRFTGKQSLEYWNNSPDTLKVLYYHLYWNAFQPGSMMDARSLELGKKLINGRSDWDPRVRDRISALTPDEMGYQKVSVLKMNGRQQKLNQYETILKVTLDKPVLPKSKVLLEMEFEAQVPVQIRRSGRDNAEGVRLSMAQWYPKLCEYDYEGWHPTPYVAREFYGVWGDYEVNIKIDKSYIIGGTGYLQNPQEIGYGYETQGMVVKRPEGKTLTWKFTAPNVHDFVWAADPEYKHLTRTVRDGMVLHAFYKISQKSLSKQYAAYSDRAKQRMTEAKFIGDYQQEWETVLDLAAKALPFIDKTFGKYPYKQYSFIQGGDGGMEYPMATLLKGAGQGVVIHEWMHSWYQMMLGTNESLYAWMDEGFTSYAESRVANYLGGNKDKFPHKGAFDSYIYLSKSDFNEPLPTHADQYNSNMAYAINAYSKGEVFMEQLGYIIGSEAMDKVLLSYFSKWRYKHPNPTDFFRVAEDVSGLQLDWYRTFFVNTSKTIEYGIDSLWEEKGKMKIRLKNNGTMPMPLDIDLHFKDGSREQAYIPQYLMFGEKNNEEPSVKRTVSEPWKWTHPYFTFEIDRKLTDLKSVEIDPLQRTADMERKNNKLELNW
ncbi:MAG: M1 family metallopeptidase [Chitinophagaceae bacterium]